MRERFIAWDRGRTRLTVGDTVSDRALVLLSGAHRRAGCSGVDMRVLIVSATTGYQLRAFDEAAGRLGVELAFATDRCHMLDDPWRDRAIPVRFYDEPASVDAIVASAREAPIDAIVAVGDRPAVLAARRRGDAGPSRQSTRRGPREREQEPDARRPGVRGSPGALVRDAAAFRRSDRFSRPRALPVRRQTAGAVRQQGSDARRLAAAARGRARAPPEAARQAAGARRAQSGARERTRRGLHSGPRVRRRRPDRSRLFFTHSLSSRSRIRSKGHSSRRRSTSRRPHPPRTASSKLSSFTRSARRRARSVCSTDRSTPNAASTIAVCTCWKSRRDRLAGSVPERCGSMATATRSCRSKK